MQQSSYRFTNVFQSRKEITANNSSSTIIILDNFIKKLYNYYCGMNVHTNVSLSLCMYLVDYSAFIYLHLH